MNDNFDNQKEILLSLRQEINLLRQQIDYLLRNERALGLLDLDVLMNRTHTVYDMLCSINLGGNEEEQELDIDPEALNGLFGGLMMNEQQDDEQEPTEPSEEEPIEDDSIEEEKEEPVENQPADETLDEQPSTTVEFVIEPTAEKGSELDEVFEPTEEDFSEEKEQKDEVPEEPKQNKEQPLGDEYGFFFRFDDVDEEPAEQQEEEPIQEEKIVHFVEEVPEDEIPERDMVDGEHLVHDNPFVMPVVEDENTENHFIEEPIVTPEEEPVFEPVEMPQEEEEPIFEPVEETIEEPAFESVVEPEEEIIEETKPEPVDEYQESEEPKELDEDDEPMPFVNDFEKDDADYELDTPQTLGEQLQHDDNTLAAKLQQNSVNELKAAIGINDKFLFVNELFGGSMEKYNRSIENLDDMKTLNGTLIYLNELKVELQWNSSNQAYQKLLSLVHRKFNQ